MMRKELFNQPMTTAKLFNQLTEREKKILFVLHQVLKAQFDKKDVFQILYKNVGGRRMFQELEEPKGGDAAIPTSQPHCTNAQLG